MVKKKETNKKPSIKKDDMIKNEIKLLRLKNALLERDINTIVKDIENKHFLIQRLKNILFKDDKGCLFLKGTEPKLQFVRHKYCESFDELWNNVEHNKNMKHGRTFFHNHRFVKVRQYLDWENDSYSSGKVIECGSNIDKLSKIKIITIEDL